jgi:AsmA protein
MPDDKKRRMRLVKIVGIIVILLVALAIAAPFIIDANQFRPKLESELSNALGRQVNIGNLRLSIVSGSIAADDISIADNPAFSRSPFVQAKSLRIGVELMPLIFSRAVLITGIVLDQPEVSLIHTPSGEWNFSNIGTGTVKEQRKVEQQGASSAPSDISIRSLRITNGRITVIRRGAQPKPRVYEKVDVQASDLSFSSVFPFTLTAALPAGGTMKLDGKAGPMNSTDASLTPVTATLTVGGFDVVASGFVDSGSGLQGILDFNGSLVSDGSQLQSKGAAKVERIRIVRGGAPTALPVSLGYVVNYNLKNQSGTLEDTNVDFGKSVAHLSGSFDTAGEAATVKLRLRGENMRAEDLESLLPAFGVTLPKGATLQGGTLNADLIAQGPVDRMVTSGSVGLFNTSLSGFDLMSKMAAVTSLVGFKSSSVTSIEKLASDLRVDPDGIQATNLQLIVPGLGELTGNGTLGSNNSMDFKMLARLNAPGGTLGSLTHLSGKALDVPFFIRGTTSDPSFVPDVKGAATSILESVIPGKGTAKGEGNKSLQDALRGLFEKKKK